MDAKEKIVWAISQMEEATDFSILAEMKVAMNSVYGEARNQIVKPSLEVILQDWRDNRVLEDYLNVLEDFEGDSVIHFLNNHCLCSFYRAIIYFPEIKIINGSKKSHLIKDMYVSFSIRPNGTIPPSIYGMRSTLTEAEYKSRYIHSHLKLLQETIKFGKFCTGTGEINQSLLLLNTGYKASNFMMFLMHIRNYLEWESREGVPYISIDNIGKKQLAAGPPALPLAVAEKCAKRLIETIATKLKAEELMDMIGFTVLESGITVRPSYKLEKWLGEQISGWGITAMYSNTYNASYFLVTSNANGSYISLSEAEIPLPTCDRVILNFKGQEIRFQVINKSEKRTNEIFANPQIIQEICKELSHLFTKTALTTPGIRSGGSITYNSKSSEPDQLPMQQDMDRRVVGDALL